jgi:hypothetical protein
MRAGGSGSHTRLSKSPQFLRARPFRRAIKRQRHAVLRQVDGCSHKIIDGCESCQATRQQIALGAVKPEMRIATVRLFDPS